MATYEVGQTIPFGLTVRDSTGALADAGTLPVCTVTRPDGTTASATVVKTSTGTYSAALASTLAGRYRATWTATGANTGGFPYSDVLDVWPADPRLVISLADARAEINEQTGVTANDDELRLFIASATTMLEDLGSMMSIGILPQTRTEEYRPVGSEIALKMRPVASVTTVTEYRGTTSTVIAVGATPGAAGESYTLNGSAGVLTRRSGGVEVAWADVVVVTYVWGSTTVAPNVVTAARALVAHVFKLGQRGWRPSFGGDDVTITPSGYAVPNRVREMLDPSNQRGIGGFA